MDKGWFWDGEGVGWAIGDSDSLKSGENWHTSKFNFIETNKDYLVSNISVSVIKLDKM